MEVCVSGFLHYYYYLFIFLLILLQDATLLWDVNKCVCSDAELSNLMVMRQGAKMPAHCESSSQLRFHPIKERQIVKVRMPASSLPRSCVSSYVTGFQCWCFFFFFMYNQGRHLGRGTRTNIFSAQLLVQGDGDSDDDDEFNNDPISCKGIPVVLKILDQEHKDIALVCFVFFAQRPKEKKSDSSLCNFWFFFGIS